jgi:hypothetical protein
MSYFWSVYKSMCGSPLMLLLCDRQPRTQGICSWGAKYPGMVWSRDPRILRKMAYCLLGLGGKYILSQLNMINLIAL